MSDMHKISQGNMKTTMFTPQGESFAVNHKADGEMNLQRILEQSFHDLHFKASILHAEIKPKFMTRRYTSGQSLLSKTLSSD